MNAIISIVCRASDKSILCPSVTFHLPTAFRRARRRHVIRVPCSDCHCPSFSCRSQKTPKCTTTNTTTANHHRPTSQLNNPLVRSKSAVVRSLYNKLRKPFTRSRTLDETLLNCYYSPCDDNRAFSLNYNYNNNNNVNEILNVGHSLSSPVQLGRLCARRAMMTSDDDEQPHHGDDDDFFRRDIALNPCQATAATTTTHLPGCCYWRDTYHHRHYYHHHHHPMLNNPYRHHSRASIARTRSFDYDLLPSSSSTRTNNAAARYRHDESCYCHQHRLPSPMGDDGMRATSFDDDDETMPFTANIFSDDSLQTARCKFKRNLSIEDSTYGDEIQGLGDKSKSYLDNSGTTIGKKLNDYMRSKTEAAQFRNHDESVMETMSPDSEYTSQAYDFYQGTSNYSNVVTPTSCTRRDNIFLATHSDSEYSYNVASSADCGGGGSDIATSHLTTSPIQDHRPRVPLSATEWWSYDNNRAQQQQQQHCHHHHSSGDRHPQQQQQQRRRYYCHPRRRRSGGTLTDEPAEESIRRGGWWSSRDTEDSTTMMRRSSVGSNRASLTSRYDNCQECREALQPTHVTRLRRRRRSSGEGKSPGSNGSGATTSRRLATTYRSDGQSTKRNVAISDTLEYYEYSMESESQGSESCGFGPYEQPPRRPRKNHRAPHPSNANSYTIFDSQTTANSDTATKQQQHNARPNEMERMQQRQRQLSTANSSRDDSINNDDHSAIGRQRDKRRYNNATAAGDNNYDNDRDYSSHSVSYEKPSNHETDNNGRNGLSKRGQFSRSLSNTDQPANDKVG